MSYVNFLSPSVLDPDLQPGRKHHGSGSPTWTPKGALSTTGASEGHLYDRKGAGNAMAGNKQRHATPAVRKGNRTRPRLCPLQRQQLEHHQPRVHRDVYPAVGQ